MSKNITVSDGNTARVFGNTKKLETRLQGEDAGTCFWVPEDETDAQPLNITENGLYEASEAGVYGFSEAHVNISKKVTDDDGTDWNIHIDDDGVPHITIDDPDDPYTGTDISIDDGTGDIDVHIPGNNPDDWPGWDDLDPDVKPEFDDWMDDPKIPGDWPGWDDLAPEIVDEFDNWIDDGNDPDLWPGWDDLDLDEKTDFDDWMDDPKDPDDWPGWDDIDPDIKTDFDDWTADIDTEIDPDEAGLDPDEDVDVSFDPDEHDVDMVGTDVDGDDVKVDYDPETGEHVEEKLPSRIEVVTPPTNPYGIYKHGQIIGKDGMVVKAYLASGGEYGTVPIGEVTLNPPIAVYDSSTDVPSETTVTSELVSQPISITTHVVREYWYHPNTAAFLDSNGVVELIEARGNKGDGSTAYYIDPNTGAIVPGPTVKLDKSVTIDGKTAWYGDANSDVAEYVSGGVTRPQPNEQITNYYWAMVYGNKSTKPAGSRQVITVLWPRPLDGKVLETTFEILVAPPIY